VRPSTAPRFKFKSPHHSTLPGETEGSTLLTSRYQHSFRLLPSILQHPIILQSKADLREVKGWAQSFIVGKSLFTGPAISLLHHGGIPAIWSHIMNISILGILGVAGVAGLMCSVSRQPDSQEEELERRVLERTRELTAANEELRNKLGELQRRSEGLRNPEEKFHQLADNIQEIFWMVDAATKEVIYVNRAFEHITGRTVASLLDAPLSYREIIHSDDHARVLSSLDHAATTGVFDKEFRIVRPDGSSRWVCARGFPIRDGQNNIYRLAGIAQDITERKWAEQALRETHAELARVARTVTIGELAASISHEIQQPLTAIVAAGSAALRWLAQQPPNLDETREAVNKVIRDANHASAVIDKIRDLLKGSPPPLKALDVNEVIREVLALVANDLVQGSVVARTELASDLPPVLGDRVLLQQVLLNLTVNAIDAMRLVTSRPRELTIRSSRDAENVLIQIQDSGKGIDSEKMPHIFEPFFTTKAEGIGLGLSISRSIIETLGGRLWAVSASPHGSVFQFSLPKAETHHE